MVTSDEWCRFRFGDRRFGFLSNNKGIFLMNSNSYKQQALERIEYIVDILRAAYVSDGFRLDEQGAARVLRYFRQRAEAQPEPEFDPERKFVWQWVNDYGQSLDWILRGDPRSLICFGAALEHEGRGASI
jgi:hypothetical protein